MRLQTQINLQQTGLREDEKAKLEHARLLHQVVTTGEPQLVAPHARLEDDRAANPTDFLLVLGRLATEGEAVGVVEIFQRPDTGLNTQQGYVRFLRQMCEMLKGPSVKLDLEAAFRHRLPDNGKRFLLHDALSAMELFHREDRKNETDLLVAGFCAIGRGAQRRVEIRLFPMFGLFHYLEVMLTFPVGLRCFLLPRLIKTCRSRYEAEEFFADIRRSRWFRRYALTSATECFIRWRDCPEVDNLFA